MALKKAAKQIQMRRQLVAMDKDVLLTGFCGRAFTKDEFRAAVESPSGEGYGPLAQAVRESPVINGVYIPVTRDVGHKRFTEITDPKLLR
jgi:hypothetical protein